MRGIRASQCARIAAVAASLALAGCSSVDDALFGGAPGGSAPPAPAPSFSASGQSSAAPAPPPAETPPPEAQEAPLTVAPAGALGPRIAAIAIASGRDTGTDVGKTTQSLREQVRTLQTKLLTNARRLGQLRSSNQRLTASYQSSRSQIESGLKGTTADKPQLVERWNAAQSVLDQLSTNLNETAGIGAAANTDSASAQAVVQQIESASSAPGAVDEDHRQLDTLEDETRQISISIERLRKEVAGDVPRETAFLATERSSLAQLQNEIRTGQPAAATAAPETAAAANAASDSSAPITVIKFDRPGVDYQKVLFAALSDALKTKPQARFEVLGIAPTAATAAAVLAAQEAARKHAADVVQTMTSMGVPAGRVTLASRTDPSVQASEVRVFAR